jgi:hypothetical protein
MSDTIDLAAREAKIHEQRLALRERQLAMSARLLDQAEQREKHMRESWDSWGSFSGLELVLDRLRSRDNTSGRAPYSTVNDRRHGHNWPFWRTWQEHARLRADARLLCGLSGIVDGALHGLGAYVIGTGFNYRSTTKAEAPEALVGAVQDVIDEFGELNEWSAQEQEGFHRSRRDGELFHLYEEDNGRLEVSVIEPEEVYNHTGDSSDWSYGILTAGRKTHKPLAYSVITDPVSFEAITYDADEVAHLKVNVDARVKRGLTDLCFDTHDTFRTAGRVIDHVGQGAAIQASIALVREHDAISPSQVADFVRASASAERIDPVSGNVEQQEVFHPGKILDINAGQRYIVPPFASNVAGYVEVIQAMLRSVAVKWNAPEWLVSADASNNNYSSSITAESPFVKRCYCERERYKGFYLKTVWKAVEVAARAGRIRAGGKVWTWDEVRRLVDIQAEAANIEVRDDNKTAQTDAVYIQAGVKSVQTTRQELGLDNEQEDVNIRQHRQATGQDADSNKDNNPTTASLLEIQAAYYAGQLPREAAAANLSLVFGLNEQQTQALLPVRQEQPTPTPPAA